MNNNKGWISCMVILVILAVVMTFLRWFGWLLFPAIIIINLVRSLLWQRKMAKFNNEETKSESSMQEPSNYCEAEFEILDDEPEENE